jgi:hypothetical protein
VYRLLGSRLLTYRGQVGGEHVIEEVLYRNDRAIVRRLILEPGEATRWHIDLCQRTTVVLGGNTLEIEDRDGGVIERVEVRPGLTGWDEPSSRPHRAVCAGPIAYEEVVVFLLDRPDMEPQPTVE